MKRYVHEKIAYLQRYRPEDEHVLIVPGVRTVVTRSERACVYSIASPLVSRRTQYRILLNLRAVEQAIEQEQPDLLESADPYQLGWAAAAISWRHRIPAVAFYHSDFAEAYLRRPAERCGPAFARGALRLARSYTRALYHRFAATLVPSTLLAEQLQTRGLQNVRVVDLGVDPEVFSPTPADGSDTRTAAGIPPERILLLYVGRLAAEKNTGTLFRAFALLTQRRPGAFHLLVVGDGQEREELRRLQASTGAITWRPYCADSGELARLYRAADLFVHPGMQETFGLVALESQACGTPVVGIRGSAMDRIILHDQAGWATQNTPEALAAALEKSAELDLSALGAAAAQAVRKRYAWPQVFARIFGIYREVMDDFRRQSRDS